MRKPTATAPLALRALVNSEVHAHGLRHAPLDLGHLHEQGRRVLVLFPSEDARVLDVDLVREDPRPITLVVPDGNWRQASRMPRRVPGLVQAPRVMLPLQAPSRWGVRRESRIDGLATFEAIARALGIIESPQVQEHLERIFTRVVEDKLATGRRRPRAAPAAGHAAPPLEIIHEDEHLVAVNKPAGVLVHRGWAHDAVPALQQLRDQLGRFVYPVHRLDRATSGALLFALSPEVARDVQELFQAGEVAKQYIALCRGCDALLGRVDHPLTKESTGERQQAVTDLRHVATFERYGLYEARPRTGRTHQIRRHLRHVSHPIIGDTRYGKGEHNRLFRQRFGFHRLALHCLSLSFVHPRSRRALRIVAALPADFSTLLQALGMQGSLGRLEGPGSPQVGRDV